MRAITARRSLSPHSHARSLNRFPYESPAIAHIAQAVARNRVFHVPILADPIARAYPFSACLSPGSADDDVLPMVTETTGCVPFGLGLTAALAQQS